MKKELAAIGRGDEMLAFSCVGVTAYTAADAAEAQELLAKLADCAVVFVSEPLCAGLKRPDGIWPIVLAVPVPGEQ